MAVRLAVLVRQLTDDAVEQEEHLRIRLDVVFEMLACNQR